MNWIDFSGLPYPAMPAEARVLIILAKYAFLGIVPMVIPSILIDVPIPIIQIPRQQGKDLQYIQTLADRVGYVFYLDPGPTPGMNVAYWGPEIKVGAPQPALNTNMDAFTNVEIPDVPPQRGEEELAYPDDLGAYLQSSHPDPVPDITPLNPPWAWIPPLPKRVDFISEDRQPQPDLSRSYRIDQGC